MKQEKIEIVGARVNNLKNINVTIPRNQLTVITGLSGSGKSSLAFDTIFAEGQRRYIDTFSSYARGYIGNVQRPDVDQITGLSPVISIDQRTTSRNPRSTVGTVTEVYDFLRLLYARAATAYSWKTGKSMVKYTDDQIVELILKEYAGEKILIMAPLVNNRKGHYKELFDSLRKKGYVYVRIDGELTELTFGLKVDRYKNHTIELVVDRLKIKAEEDISRLRQSIDKAMIQGGGMMMVNERFFSRTLMDPETGLSYREPAPHSFSFNSPSGWCPCCKGLGKIESALLAAKDTTMDDIIHNDNWLEQLLNLTAQSDDDESEEKASEQIVCPECNGKRLNKEALSYYFYGKSIDQLSEMDLEELLSFFSSVVEGTSSGEIRLTDVQRFVAEPIIKEITVRLRFMISVGLSYLSLSRSADSLSGGESQRIRLATQIGSKLVNVLYVLDEPSIGLHQRDNDRLIRSLKELRDMGNSVIVVEHDEQMMREADYIVDIGPRAGRLGGEVMFQGTPAELLQTDTLTARYLKGDISNLITAQSKTTQNSRWLVLEGCTGNNLKDVTLHLPLGKMVGITGVSGSGKSTLINQTLYPILSQMFYRSLQQPLPYRELRITNSRSANIDKEDKTDKTDKVDKQIKKEIDKVIAVDQSPIGRTPRSNPATYTNVFNDIRELFAQLPESKIRAWKAGRFSFNTKGGRCEECTGNGYKTIRMNFMPDVYVQCEECGGRRYNRETLEVKFKGKNIGEVLDMTVNQAVEFFESQPSILKKIKTIQDVGLGYLKLGQSSTTLSGGESQRIKLASELSRPNTGKTLYILDEPTTGLHFEDIRVLLDVLRKLVNKGNTVIIIEHNLDVIRSCDYLVDMGPGGGRYGGTVVAEGSVEDIKNNKNSQTGKFLE